MEGEMWPPTEISFLIAARTLFIVIACLLA